MSRLFITGTDTGVGKTVFTTALIHACQAAGHKVMAYKPVASDAELTPDGLCNADALAIQAALDNTYPLAEVNPWTFAPAIAPHIAAQQVNQTLSATEIAQHCTRNAMDSDITLIEGVGGWLVPLNDTETCADIAEQADAAVILVVGIQLGCINHALLTAAHISGASNQRLLGWVANCLTPPTAVSEANITSINKRLNIPLIATLPYQKEINPRALAEAIPYELIKNLTKSAD